jgi:peptide/nickel transport system substrate-binding protein
VNLPEYQQTLAMLKTQWQAIGVQVNVATFTPEEMQTQVIKKRSYDALLFGQIIGTDPDPYPFWHASQQEHPGLALSIFLDRDINQLLEDARKTTNADERAAKYVDFQNKLAADIPAIFLYNPLYTYAVHEKVHGISPQQYINIPSDRFAQIANWYVKTDRKRTQ